LPDELLLKIFTIIAESKQPPRSHEGVLYNYESADSTMGFLRGGKPCYLENGTVFSVLHPLKSVCKR
ncbi:hypothetical protein PFISCL1PPCAC_28471, partial [Pristionchus fissidentatus]